ncbi:MAG: phage neck terminator protein [Pseudomonas sp.]
MIATITQVENAFAALLALIGRELVEGRVGEAGAPAVPYALWSLENLTISDFPVKTFLGVDQRIIATGTPFEFLVNFCGGDAMGDAAKFVLSFRQSQRLNELYKFCGLSGFEGPSNRNAVEVGNFRKRVELRVTLFSAIDLLAPAELLETSCVDVISAAPVFDETICVTQGECH